MSAGQLYYRTALIKPCSSFLPQDKVAEFARMSPQELLRETQHAAGNSSLASWHESLIEKGKELKKMTEVYARHKQVAISNMIYRSWIQTANNCVQRRNVTQLSNVKFERMKSVVKSSSRCVLSTCIRMESGQQHQHSWCKDQGWSTVIERTREERTKPDRLGLGPASLAAGS